MKNSLKIIKDKTLTYHQQVFSLAKTAEDDLNILDIHPLAKELLERGIICSMFEGSAPYRPRYIIPDYQILIDKGCSFLDLEPPESIWDAVNNLLIFYKHVPSVDYFPVYLGNLDTLLDPFIEDEDEAFKAILFFLKHIDRTLTGSFVHANIGPLDTKAGRLILRASEKLNTAIPNLTLKYEEGVTSDDFLTLCAATTLETAKPSFANHKMFKKDFNGDNYAIASCYNGLLIGGGGYTLSRLKLGQVSLEANSVKDYLEVKLPEAVNTMLTYMNERIRFLVEDSAFFKSNFLVKEGFISQDKFTGMFGMVGLAEAVNNLLGSTGQEERFGHSAKADALGLQIIETINDIVKDYQSPHVTCFDGRFLLHAQVGLDSDIIESPGCRIPIGEEPEIHNHILQSAPYHSYFVSGIGDIFMFEKTYKQHPEALAAIVKGALKSGLRYFSAYSSDSDVIRVTGYLVKRSQMEKLGLGKAVRNQSTVLGLNQNKDGSILNRRLR